MITMTNAKKSTFAKISLAGMLLAFAPSMQAINVIPSGETVISAAKKAGYAVLFLSIVRYLTRKPDNKPARYNIDELVAGENVANNLRYLYDDGLWGHAKESSVLKANPENDYKLEVTPNIPAKGLIGNAASYAKPVATAYIFMEFIRNGGDLGKLFKDYAKKLETDSGKAFFAFIGAFAGLEALKAIK